MPDPVRWLFRAPDAFSSIEGLFDSIERYLVRDRPVTKHVVSSPRARPFALLRNLLDVASIPTGGILHVTGDIHYAVCMAFRPSVLTIHDLRFLDESHGLRRWLMWCFWLCLPVMMADRVTVISATTRDRLLAWLPWAWSKIRVVPNGVGDAFQLSPKEWPQGRPRVLQAGTTPNKNLDRVIEACRGMDLTLVVLGDLDEAGKRRIADAGIDAEFHARLGRDAVVALYESCDVVIFASTYEGFGLPILEAQAVGRPLITSNVAPMNEVAGGAALLVDPFEAASIRDALKRIMRDAVLRDELVRRGLENLRHWRMDAVAAGYEQVYREVLAETSEG